MAFGGGFSFGAPTTGATATTGGFGATTTGGFGAPAAAAVAAPAAGGFSFGAAPSATATPAATGGGFGGFGTTAPAAASTTGGFSFGATPAPAPAAAAAGGFGFGSTLSTAAAPAAASTGLGGFGGFGGFGAAAAKPAATSFGGFGGLGTAAAAAAPGQTAQPGQLLQAHTYFEDLPKDVQKMFEDLDKHVREQTTLRDEIAEHSKRVRTDIKVETLRETLTELSSNVSRDSYGIQSFKLKVREELKNAEIALRNIQKALTPAKSSTSLHENVYLPSKYHWSLLEQFTVRMGGIQKLIDEIDQYLACGAEQQNMANSPEALQVVLQAQHDAVIAISSKVATLHPWSDQLREAYIKHSRVNGKSVENVFKEPKQPELKKGSLLGFQHQQQAQQSGLNAAGQTSVAPAVLSLGGSTGTGFGSTGSAFGASSGTTASTGFGTGSTGFGTAATTATTAGSTGFGGFGSSLTTPAATGGFAGSTTTGGFGSTTGGFGAAATATGGGFSFGLPASPPSLSLGGKTGFGSSKKGSGRKKRNK